jgi:hypothetical protein
MLLEQMLAAGQNWSPLLRSRLRGIAMRERRRLFESCLPRWYLRVALCVRVELGRDVEPLFMR